jgi:heme-degrading monooxygenase HmoA
MMTVKILIRRNFLEGTHKAASEMLIQARTNALSHKGYISSETLHNCDDPNTVMVVSMWEKKEDWDSYATSSDRMDNERKFAEILDGQTEYEIFNLGIGG